MDSVEQCGQNNVRDVYFVESIQENRVKDILPP